MQTASIFSSHFKNLRGVCRWIGSFASSLMLWSGDSCPRTLVVYWYVLIHLGGVRVFWPPLQTLVSLVLVLEEQRSHDCGSYAAYLLTALDSYRFKKKMPEEFWGYVKPIGTRVRPLGHQFVIVAFAQCSGGASATTAWPVVLRMPFVDHNDP